MDKKNLKDIFNKKTKIENNKSNSKQQDVSNQKQSIRNQNIQYKGLSNSGNNLCYSNAVMQCLVSCKEFHSILETALKIIEEDEALFQDCPILFNLCKFLQFYKMKSVYQASQHMKEIVKRFDPQGEQNDAHEFLTYLLDKVNEDAVKVNLENKSNNKEKEFKKTNDEGEWEEVKKGGKRMKLGNNLNEFKLTLIGDTFQGVLKIETETKGQSVSNSLLEPFFVLSLDLPQNKAQYDEINSLFKLFFSKRDVDTGNTTKLVQRSYLERPPSILIVHLKTFLFDQTSLAVTKTSRLLIYEESIIINKDYLSPSTKSTYGDIKYELFSIIIHKGKMASEGHYICYCKDEKGAWWNLDDNNIFKVDKSNILKVRPYILFYRRAVN